MMDQLVIAVIAAAALTVAVGDIGVSLMLAQYDPPPYGGPPMWDRDYRDWGVEERQRRLPPPREYGPPMPGCIQFGNCRRSPPPEYGLPPFRYPPPRFDGPDED